MEKNEGEREGRGKKSKHGEDNGVCRWGMDKD